MIHTKHGRMGKCQKCPKKTFFATFLPTSFLHLHINPAYCTKNWFPLQRQSASGSSAAALHRFLRRRQHAVLCAPARRERTPGNTDSAGHRGRQRPDCHPQGLRKTAGCRSDAPCWNIVFAFFVGLFVCSREAAHHNPRPPRDSCWPQRLASGGFWSCCL